MPPDDPEPEGFLPQGGNYRELLSFRKSETVFDFTFRFCDRFFKKSDRTIDQMVQSARSGKQNIGEGCKASITSAEMELKLVNVARASLEELLLDYQDYLRVRDHALWDKNSKEALYVRKLGRTPDESYEPRPPEWPRQIDRRSTRRALSSGDDSVKPIDSSWTPVRQRSLRTSPSASSIRRITSSTSSAAVWRRTSSKKAASASK